MRECVRQMFGVYEYEEFEVILNFEDSLTGCMRDCKVMRAYVDTEACGDETLFCSYEITYGLEKQLSKPLKVNFTKINNKKFAELIEFFEGLGFVQQSTIDKYQGDERYAYGIAAENNWILQTDANGFEELLLKISLI